MTMLIPWDGPERWEILARYNAEVARGIVHTDEWRDKMAQLQREFHAEQEAKLLAEGARRVGNLIVWDKPQSRWRWPWQR